MAGQKVIQKNFENFRGNDRGASDLTRAAGFSIDVQNVRINDDLSATKRDGWKPTWRPLLSGVGNSCYSRFSGIFPYSYLNKLTGATEQELLAVATSVDGSATNELVSAQTYPFLIGSTQPTPTITIRVDEINELYEVDLQTVGVSEPGWPKTYGDGFSLLATEAEEQLRTDINATTGWLSARTAEPEHHVACMPIVTDLAVGDYAIANGTQTNVTTITVDAGHGIVAGDVVYIRDSSPLTPERRIQVRVVDSITATTIIVVGDPVTVTNNFMISTTVLETRVPSERPAPYGFVAEPTLNQFDVGFINPSAISLNDLCFWQPYGDYLRKYDGQKDYRAGMPIPADVDTGFLGVGAGTLTGDYIYHYTYRFRDARGNIIESQRSSDIEATGLSANYPSLSYDSPWSLGPGQVLTVAGGPSTTITNANPETLQIGIGDYLFHSGTGLRYKVTAVDYVTPSVTIDTSVTWGIGDRLVKAQVGFNDYVTSITGQASNTLTVGTHEFRIGDTVIFNDTATDQLLIRTVTERTATTITVDGDAFTAASGRISNGMTVAWYRTDAGGVSDKFLVAEYPISKPSSGVLSQLVGPETGTFEQYIPPSRTPAPPQKGTIVSQHQGVPIIAGDKDNPNTVFFGEPFDVESFPVATNAVDIPFTTRGPITGFASDNEVLVVFKELGRAVIRGGLLDDTFTVEVIEDGVGCFSHHAIAQTPIGFIFPSRRGFQLMQSGQLEAEFSARTTALMGKQAYIQQDGIPIATADETKRVFKRAVAINDWRTGHYICYVPTEKGTPGTNRAPSGNETWYVYDYSKDAWFDDVMGETVINAIAGLAIVQERLFAAGTWYAVDPPTADSHIESVIWNEYDTGTLADAMDNTKPIAMTLPLEWDHAEEPSVFKKFLRMKTWVNSPANFIGAFTLKVRTYLNFSKAAAHTEIDQTFSSSTQTQSGPDKLRGAQRVRALQFEFSNNVAKEKPIITGYEYEVVYPYRGEMKE